MDVGCGDAFFSPEQYPGHLRDHYNTTGHPYVLKLSADHFLEVWCYACNKPVSDHHHRQKSFDMELMHLNARLVSGDSQMFKNQSPSDTWYA